MAGDNIDALDELRSRISAHPGYIASVRWTTMNRTLSLHFRNSHELLAVIGTVEADPLLGMRFATREGNDSPEKAQFIAEFDQRLHNVVASASTVIDHAREMMTAYVGTPFGEAFEARNAAVRDDGRAAFLRRLRNFLLHVRGVLPITNTFSMSASRPGGAASLASSVRLDIKTMLAWSGWTAPSRSYLLSAGKFVDLGEVLRWYHSATAELWVWANTAMHEHHVADFAERDNLVDEYDQLYATAFPASHDPIDRQNS